MDRTRAHLDALETPPPPPRVRLFKRARRPSLARLTRSRLLARPNFAQAAARRPSDDEEDNATKRQKTEE